MSRRSATARAWILALAVAALPQAAPAEPPPGRDDPAATWFVRGGKHAAFSAGYGIGFRTGSKSDREKSRELGDVSLIELVPRVAIGITDPLGGDAWYRGNVEMSLEGAVIFNTEPRFGWAAGGGSTLRYNLLYGRRLVPFLDANFGLLHLDFDLEGQSDGFNLNVGFGTGFHWFLSERTALTPAVRWQHISNAGTSSPNAGINDVLFLIGASYFWK
jgi:hypothetical protein